MAGSYFVQCPDNRLPERQQRRTRAPQCAEPLGGHPEVAPRPPTALRRTNRLTSTYPTFGLQALKRGVERAGGRLATNQLGELAANPTAIGFVAG